MKVKCSLCQWQGQNDSLLVADNPFLKGDTISACPDCLSIQTTEVCCEEPGCWDLATCGTPFGVRQYKSHCYNHPPVPTNTCHPVTVVIQEDRS